MTSFDSTLGVLQGVFAALFGLAFGSFGTVLATRMIAGESISRDGSHCRDCGAPLTWRQNIPVLSWMIQRGKCSECKEPISVAYPLTEVTTALLFVATVGTRLSVESIGMTGLAVVTAPLIWTDLKTHRLPNPMTYGFTLFAIACALASLASDGNTQRLTDALTWGLVPAAAMFALNLISRGGMGMGDVKLSLGLGITLALQSTAAMAAGFIVAFVLAAIVSAVSLAFRRTSMKSAIPFGPYLLLGAWVSYLLGPTLQVLITSPWALTF